MASLTRTIALAALAGALMTVPAAAQTQADFDVCNQQAAAQVGAGSPSASPSSSAPVTNSSPGTSVGGSTMTAPGSTDVNRQPNGTGRISGSAGSPGSNIGTVHGGTQETVPSPSTATGVGSAAQGMAQAGQSNPAYQQAFRDCLKARGF
jgi:hypothetical protein